MQYFALYTQLETLPEDGLSGGRSEDAFGDKISLKSGAKTSRSGPATTKVKRKARLFLENIEEKCSKICS